MYDDVRRFLEIQMKATLLLCLLGVSAIAVADDGIDPIEKAIERIETECAELRLHPWAGHYVAGGGFNSVSLWIAPESGAVFQSSGCMHHDRCRGDVRTRDGAIVIDWAENDSAEPFVASRQFVPVHYGNTTQIVPLGRLHSFLIRIKRKDTYSAQMTSDLPRRTNDKRPLINEPRVPRQFQQLLELPAISASIISVGDPERTRQPPLHHSLAQELQLNVGASDGVIVGMQFELTQRGLSHQVVTITDVTPDRSTGIMHVKAEVGQRISPARRTWLVQTATWR
ncbi:MAG: hypothetical protein AAGI63_19415 [Planctomycetota bacterium]